MTLVEPIERWTDRPLPWALMLPFAYTTVEPRRSKVARIGTKTRLLRMTGGWSKAMTCPLTTTVTLAAKIGPIVAAAAIAAAAAKPAGRLNPCIPIYLREMIPKGMLTQARAGFLHACSMQACVRRVLLHGHGLYPRLHYLGDRALVG